MQNKKSGFSLLELTVVITIIAMIGAMGLSVSMEAMSAVNQVATNNRLDTIEKSLFSFWQKNGRLPCPADATLATSNASYGKENAGCTSLTPVANFTSATNKYKAAEGAVPIVTLGLPKDFIYDGWKRKIAYAVKPEFASAYARERIPVKSGICVANTAIRIKDSSGAARTVSAMYALVSYGKNGHGAYPVTGSTRYNAGASNADELTNCHCNASGANTTYDGNYVQRKQNLNTTTAASYFDDIVRYKERWQFATPEDSANDDGYRGPDLAVGYVKAATGTVYTYKNQCGAFVKQPDLSPLPTNAVLGVAFTTGNKHLLTYSAAGCNLYKIGTNGKPKNIAGAFVTDKGVAAPCTYDASAVMALSNNGYLAISHGWASPVIHLWKQAGDKFIQLTDLTHTPAVVEELSFSPDAKLLAVRGGSSQIYKRKGDSFSNAAADITQPIGFAAFSGPSSLVFSPDGKYLADAEYDVPNNINYINVWRVLGEKSNSFAPPISFSPTIVTANPLWRMNSLAFSPEGNYLLANMYEEWAEGPTNGLLIRIDAGDVFGGGFVNMGGYQRVANIEGSDMAVYGTMYYSSSRGGYYYIQTKNESMYNDTPNIAKKNSGSSFKKYFYLFQSNDSPGNNPTRLLDKVLSGSTGGPVAFAH